MSLLPLLPHSFFIILPYSPWFPSSYFPSPHLLSLFLISRLHLLPHPLLTLLPHSPWFPTSYLPYPHLPSLSLIPFYNFNDLQSPNFPSLPIYFPTSLHFWSLFLLPLPYSPLFSWFHCFLYFHTPYLSHFRIVLDFLPLISPPLIYSRSLIPRTNFHFLQSLDFSLFMLYSLTSLHFLSRFLLLLPNFPLFFRIPLLSLLPRPLCILLSHLPYFLPLISPPIIFPYFLSFPSLISTTFNLPFSPRFRSIHLLLFISDHISYFPFFILVIVPYFPASSTSSPLIYPNLPFTLIFLLLFSHPSFSITFSNFIH